MGAGAGSEPEDEDEVEHFPMREWQILVGENFSPLPELAFPSFSYPLFPLDPHPRRAIDLTEKNSFIRESLGSNTKSWKEQINEQENDQTFVEFQVFV